MNKIAMLLLFAFALAESVFADDGKKNGKNLPHHGQISIEKQESKWHKPIPPVEFTGVLQFAAWQARTGEMVVLPSVNFTEVVEAKLTFGPGFFANLYTKDVYAGVLVREMNWPVMMGPDGKLALRLPDRAIYRIAPDFEPIEITNQVAQFEEHTGCPVNGTYPTFYGSSDGKLFHASTEVQGVCTGGNMWGSLYGVSEALGPLHVDILLSLEAVD